MFARIRKSVRLRLRRRRERRLLAGFDPVWYQRRYADLAALRGIAEVRHHYLAHGLVEGRHASAQAEEEAEYHRYLTPSPQFDIAAYRLLNPDLAGVFREDRDFILHYIRNGRAEGRPAVFPAGEDGDDAADGGGQPWTRIFSVGHYWSWVAQDGAVPPFASRAEALAHFRAHGMAALAPIHLDHLFDPRFYRAHYGLSEPDDAALYADWLDHGLPEGRAANEAQALLPFIGHAAFPEQFDWRGYARLRGLPDGSRVAALAALFEAERQWDEVVPLIAEPRAALLVPLLRQRLARDQAADGLTLLAAFPEEPAWPAALHALRGALLDRQGRAAEALEACDHALRLGDDSWANFARAVRLAAALGDGGRAIALLRAQRQRWLGQADYAALVETTVDRLFGAASEAAMAAFRIMPAAAAGEAFTVALAELAQAIADLEPAPAGLVPPADGPVVVLGNEAVRQCTHYRLEQKAEQFAVAGIALRRHAADDAAGFIADLPGARAAIFYRVPATPDVMRAILAARAMGIPTFYEIDDLLFDAEVCPPPLASFGGLIGETQWEGMRHAVPLFRFALALCDRAIASTPALLAHMAPLTREGTGVVIRNGLDSRNRAAIALGGRPRAASGRIRIFYGSGTLAHAEDFSTIAAPALARLMAGRDEVDLVLVGHVPRDAVLEPFGDRVLRYPFIASITDYWSVLAACDIALAVLAPGRFEDAKSEIKWLEAAAAGIPTVASATATFREVIVPGETGLLASSPDEWRVALEQLCADSAARERIGAAARARALHDYALEAIGAAWPAVFAPAPAPAPAPASAAAPAPRRPRVLVVNVFFAPQSLGGATRVVEDNVHHLAEDGGIDLAVFCLDHGFGPPGRLRTTGFGSVPVYRVALPPGGEGLIDDPAVLPAFRRVLDLFAPDLVHFHCMQRLTAAPLRECRDSGVPYVVTAHDGWWLSPHQFLMDQDGLLRLPGPDLFAGLARRPAATAAALRHRQHLAPLLLGAARLLTVSEKFAEIYRSAGLPGIEVVANGLPALPAPIADPDPPTGPLRLAHIGGRASHKGADLVEAALRRGAYPNLSLLMVDGRLPAGETVRTRWGASEVCLSAEWPQAEVARLYGRTDVLLAPSRCPESFGLVTREAEHYGCSVVASDLGAIGADVVPERTGFVVDVSGAADLQAVLARLDATPQTYRRGVIAPRAAPGRTARDQAADLARVYREIVAATPCRAPARAPRRPA
ncbi:glycosyltransferase [Novosphingobium bradum]|uniref:Glycosyltransferase n=1 Tax=Novosphingobium bradum TaxID=1737444 RepID=A0ABV7INV9_9SPHN